MASWAFYVWPLLALGQWGLGLFYLSRGHWFVALWFGVLAGEATAKTVQVWTESAK